jgi:hypothetical protein
MNKKIKTIFFRCLIGLLLYALGGKFIAHILESSSICHSSTLYESQKDGFFRTFYELTKESREIIDSLNLMTENIWAEKSHGYKADYFGKYSKEELKYLSLSFPVQNILTENGYPFYSFELDTEQRLFTSGYDVQNNRYNFVPKYLEDTLHIIIKKRDSIEGWKKPNKIAEIDIVRK